MKSCNGRCALNNWLFSLHSQLLWSSNLKAKHLEAGFAFIFLYSYSSCTMFLGKHVKILLFFLYILNYKMRMLVTNQRYSFY